VQQTVFGYGGSNGVTPSLSRDRKCTGGLP